MIKKKVSLLLVSLLSLFFCFQKINVTSSIKKGNYGVIDWDNFGYYMYLPAVFIHKDVTLKDAQWAIDAQKEYRLSSNFYQAHLVSTGNRVIQYTSGMAFVYSPAFFVAHISAKVFNYKTDGFSKPYQVAVLIQSFLMVFLGLFYLRRLSLQFFSEKLTVWLLLILCLGTNYFQIAPGNISSPHVYYFAFYAAILYYMVKWHESPKLGYAAVIGFLLALMILGRPNELLFIIVPLFWVGGRFLSLQDKFNYFLRNKKHLIAIVVPLIIFGVIQPIYWKFVTGEVIHDSYRNEGFRLLDPYLFNYLFSYKKGWLLYTPIMIFSLLGFISLIRDRPKQGAVLLIFSVLNIWVLSSWDCWWYADSFSQRSIVQSYPVFYLSLGFLVKEIHTRYSKLTAPFSFVIAGLIGFNLFQVFQFNNWILHSQLMTKEYYWDIFGETDGDNVDRILLDIDRNLNYLPKAPIVKQRVLYNRSFESEGNFAFKGYNYNKEGSLFINKESRLTTPIKFAVKDLYDSTYAYLRCRVRLKSDYSADENNFGIEFTAEDVYHSKPYGYKHKNLNNLEFYKKGEWNTVELVVVTPIFRSEEDSVQFNFIHFGQQPIEVDQVLVELFDPSSTKDNQSLGFYSNLEASNKWHWSTPNIVNKEEYFELIDSTNQYSSTFKIPLRELGKRRRLQVQTTVNLTHNYSNTNAVISVNKGPENLYHKAQPMIRGKLDWEVFSAEVELLETLDPEAELKVYLWNKTKSITLIKDLKIIIK